MWLTNKDRDVQALHVSHFPPSLPFLVTEGLLADSTAHRPLHTTTPKATRMMVSCSSSSRINKIKAAIELNSIVNANVGCRSLFPTPGN